MSLPSRVEVLVVGAGPTGLVAAITLAGLGLQVAIVDSSTRNQNGSRAAAVHAHTLEILDSIGLAKPIIDTGIRCRGVVLRGTTDKILEVGFEQLRDITAYPFSVLIPQHAVEGIFRERLTTEGTAVDLCQDERGSGVDVRFDDGNVVNARYVIGADGAHSTIRRLVGIEFKDPRTGIAFDDSTVPPAFYIVFADVYLEEPLPMGIHRDKLSAHLDDFLLFVPLYDVKGSSPKAIPMLYWRVGYLLPASGPRPPRNPSMEYLQQMMDARNPWDTRITILSVLSSSSYRVRAAVASTYFRKVGDGNILLIGDAAHVHSPVGGQGMNLGICDAVAVAHAVRAHSDTSSDTPDPKHPERDDVLLHYANSRRMIGVRVVGLTTGLTTLLNAGRGWRRILRNFVLRAVSYLPFMNRLAAWRISGLANKDL
ncbi:hypothetical protein JB92DRAFT_3063428 [Gautieria morchelliformis]|nr:hypothetical protein JB92DRAFT_3063428 [Gautieria morchelliformis]